MREKEAMFETNADTRQEGNGEQEEETEPGRVGIGEKSEDGKEYRKG